MPEPHAAAPPRAPDAEVLHEAAEWYAALSHKSEDGSVQQLFQRWLDADDRHADAWQRVEKISQRFEDLPASFDKTAALQALNRVERRRGILKLVALGAAALPAFLVLREEPWVVWTAEHRTGIGEQREVRLSDGTRVWLNTDSALSVAFDSHIRRLELHRGEILVETAHETPSGSRPFEVRVAEGQVRPLGTRFNLHRAADGSRLAVYAGEVEVQAANGPHVRRVGTGRQVRFGPNGIDTEERANAAREAWTRGLIVADNMRLGDFVAELSRYHAGHVACADEVADLRIFGTFPLRDHEQIYQALERSLPVRVARPLRWWVTVRAA